MKLFHGTGSKFTTPDLDVCRKYKDFGQGFYLTENIEMARNWAVKQKANGPAFVNAYMIDDTILADGDLNVKVFGANAEWVEFVYKNRTDESFSHPYDIVIGPVADNVLPVHFAKIQRDEKRFEDIVNDIRYDRFKGLQYCFCTRRAINKLAYYDRY